MNFIYQNYLHFELLLVDSDKKFFSSVFFFIYIYLLLSLKYLLLICVKKL